VERRSPAQRPTELRRTLGRRSSARIARGSRARDDPKGKLLDVTTPIVEGVKIERHPLDALVQQQLRVARVLGQRVIDWDRLHGPEKSKLTAN
jgi:hypothetical protein